MATFARIAEAHLNESSDVQQHLTAFVREAALALATAPDRADPADHDLGAVLSGADSPGNGPAEHLFALTFGQISSRTMFGAVQLSDASGLRSVPGLVEHPDLAASDHLALAVADLDEP